GFAVVVREGPDRGRRVSFRSSHPGRLLVGKSPSCEVRLVDETVSRRHAALEIEGDRVRITDLGSTNGTRVDDVRVYDAALTPGQLVRMGATAWTLEVEAAARDATPPAATRFGKLLGASPAMRRLYPLCERLAASTVSVIIEGETGTGKEVLAEALHEASPRAAGPFVVFDCTAVPASLVEAELFGHERGAFTSAVATRRGVFEQAHGGTLLIDEIGDLDLALQPKLLRAIERSEIRRVGGAQTIKVDVRVLSATRRDLDAEVQAGRFRDDLFHRLAVARIELPPLRARRSDIPLLARAFAREMGGAALPDDLLVRLREQDWPGNVRELRNAVARRLALGDAAALPEAPAEPPEGEADFIAWTVAQKLPLPIGRKRVVDEYERRYVERVLADHGGNVGEAARASGIARRYFQIIRARSR
ncbi:MAG TPA: sigma 54-interacting transcriptional regulator, partial [Minicystis sp.]|nr:sigma 54-interacting transcriptional regulator [Minicystis sp.]